MGTVCLLCSPCLPRQGFTWWYLSKELPTKFTHWQCLGPGSGYLGAEVNVQFYTLKLFKLLSLSFLIRKMVITVLIPRRVIVRIKSDNLCKTFSIRPISLEAINVS